MPGKFVLSKDASGGFRFTLHATNGQVVAVSQAYTTRRSALAGIDSVRRHAPSARLVDEARGSTPGS